MTTTANITHTTINCVKKHFYYIFSLTKVPVTLEYEGEKWTIEPRPYKVTESFYRTYWCKACGQCCISKRAIIFDSNVYNKNNKLLEQKCVKDYIVINGKKFSFYRSEEGQPCVFLDKKTKKCLIYPDRPVLSRMPHIFFDTREGEETLYINQRQFGRNWALKCKAKEEPFSYEYFDRVMLPTLRYLEKCIKRYGIPSKIGQVIKEAIQGANDYYMKKYSEELADGLY